MNDLLKTVYRVTLTCGTPSTHVLKIYGHMIQVRPICQLDERKQGAPLCIAMDNWKGRMSMNPLGATVKSLIMEAFKRATEMRREDEAR